MDAKTARFREQHGTVVRQALETYADKGGGYVLDAALNLYAEPGHDEVIDEALAFYADYMRGAARGCQAGASQPEPGPAASTPGTISIRPTRGGFTHMAGMFTEQAERADRALAAYRKMAGYVPGQDETGA